MNQEKLSTRFIPQNSSRLKELQEQFRPSYKTETALAEAMVTEMRLYHPKAWIDQPGVSRILNGKEAITTLELVALSKLFQTTTEDLLRSELRRCLDSKATALALRQQHTAEESDTYLADLESDGRILAFSEFPSLLFSTEVHPRRKAQMLQSSYENIEYYTVDGYLDFLFSIVSRFSLHRRIEVLEQYIQYFGSRNGRNKRRIAFFSRHNFSAVSGFSSLELFLEKSTLIMRAPILHPEEGDTFLEINDAQLCKEVENFYTNQIDTIRNPLNLLEIGKATLSKQLDGMCMEESVVWFYNKCQKLMEFSSDPDVIYAGFCPEIQALLVDGKV